MRAIDRRIDENGNIILVVEEETCKKLLNQVEIVPNHACEIPNAAPEYKRRSLHDATDTPENQIKLDKLWEDTALLEPSEAAE